MFGRDPVPPESEATGVFKDASPVMAEAAALRDAHAIAARVAADEQAADAERSRLQKAPLPDLRLPLNANVGLPRGERLHAVRMGALLDRGGAETPVGGTLYLTSARMVHVAGAGAIYQVPLSSITDIAVAVERLLLIELADGSGLAIEVEQPRLLRVQLAAARATVR